MTGKSIFRYAALGLHPCLWLAMLMVNLFIGGGWFTFILLICSGIAWLVYVPATLFLSAKNSSSRYDHAGGEVAYTVIQQIINLMICLYSIVVLSVATYCYAARRGRGAAGPSECYGVLVIAILSAINFFVVLGWMSLVIHAARRVTGLRRAEGMMIPAHRLMSGKIGPHAVAPGTTVGAWEGALSPSAYGPDARAVDLVERDHEPLVALGSTYGQRLPASPRPTTTGYPGPQSQIAPSPVEQGASDASSERTFTGGLAPPAYGELRKGHSTAAR